MTAGYDVFLCHNKDDKPSVKKLARRLEDERRLRPFLDIWHLIPGEPWQEAIEEALKGSSTCAVFIGPRGISPWEHEEMRAAIERRITDRTFRVIPVLLPGAARGERGRLPAFLGRATWVEFRKSLDDDEAFRCLVAGIKGIAPGRKPGGTVYEGVCPYRGLQVFEEEHAPFFFGREAAVEWLVDELRGNHFLAVIGPSGSGKSSLVRAGLVPALRRGALPGSDNWPLYLFRPGYRPLESLALALTQATRSSDDSTALSRLIDALGADHRQLHLTAQLALASVPPDRTVALVVDQFEEIFTLCRDEAQRALFIDNLLYASSIDGGRVVAVLTMRADFYPRCAIYPDLAARLTDHQMLVSPLTEDELRQAIERPAQMVGLEFESSLVEILLRDVAKEPGALPLLQHTLLELWERREGHHLTSAAYREIGEVQGAIAHRAESIYSAFDTVQQAITRRILLRLTQPGEGTEDTRRRTTLTELLPAEGEAADVEAVVHKLANSRLLTTGKDERGSEIVDVAHEALIQGWPRLRSWIDEDRAGLLTHRHLAQAAEEWGQHERDGSYLYRGARLAEAEEWAEAHTGDLNDLEHAFLESSVKLRDQEAQEGERQRRRELEYAIQVAEAAEAQRLAEKQRAEQAEELRQAEAERARVAEALRREAEAREQEQAQAAAQLRRLVILLVTVGAAMFALAIFAFEQLRQADQARAVAERQRNISRSQEIAAVARDQMEVDAELSLLLATEATKMTHTFEAENVLREALVRSRVRAVLPGCENSSSACTVNDVAWSPDGIWLASALSDGTIQVRDADDRRLIITLKTNANSINSLSWSPDGTQLGLGASDGLVRLWNVETGELTILGDLSSPINIVVWSPNGQELAFVASDNLVQVWDVQAKRTAAMLAGHESTVTDVAWSPDGRRLASGSDDTAVRLWDVETGRSIFTLEDHELAVTSVAWSPDGGQLASASYDKTVRLWDPETGESLGTPLAGHKFVVYSVAWSADGTRLATGSCTEFDDLSNCLRGESRLWDVQTGDTLAILNGHTGAVLSLAWRPGLAQLASASSDGTVRLWDAETGEGLKTLAGHTDYVLDVAWNPDGTQLVSASQDKTIRIWNATSTLSTTAVLTNTPDSVLTVAWSPNGKWLASGSRDGTVRLWDVVSRLSTAILSGHEAPVNDAAWSPNGIYLASASDDRTVRVWDARTGEIIHVLSDHQDAVKSVAWNPEGKKLASASSDKTVRVWDVETGKCVNTLADLGYSVTSVAWSPDGRRLAYALADNTIRLWDFETGREIFALASHERSINQVAWSPDGRYLATAANDRTVRLWDAETGECIAILTRHADWATSVAWSPDGTRLASASYDRTVRILHSQYTDLMDIARGQITRSLSPEERRVYLGEK